MSDHLDRLDHEDRQALAGLLAADADVGAAFEPPTTDLERTLCAILADNLEAEEIGLTDDLFAYGGDSTTVMAIVADAAERGLVITAEALFENPTVLALAATVVDAGPGSQPTADARLPGEEPTADPSGRFPVTELQAHIAAASRSDPSTYVTSVACILGGALDLERLTDAWTRVGAHLEAIHATFHHEDGQWWQRLDQTTELDVGPGQEADRSAGWLGRWRDRSPELGDVNGPLLRVRHLHLDSSTTAIELIHHHLLLDGWSQQLLMAHVEAAYLDPNWSGANLGGRYRAWLRTWPPAGSPPAPRPPSPMAGTGAVGPLRLTAEQPRPARASESVAVELGPAASARLAATSREGGVTSASLVSAVWSVVVWQLTGCGPAVELGTVVSGREGVVGGGELIGMMIETIAVGVDGLSPDRRFGDVAREVQRRSVAGRQRTDGLPEPRRRELESVVVVQNMPVSYRVGGTFAGYEILTLEQRIVETAPVLFEWVDGPPPGATVRYDRRLVEPGQAAAMADAVAAILARLDPGTPIGELGGVVADAVDRRSDAGRDALADQLRTWSSERLA